jgi:RNA-directed DNA polymerase
MRLAKATKADKQGKVKSLQWILTHSFYAKALAVKRVTSNRGKNTPGVDGVLWQGSRAKMQAVRSVRQHGYTPNRYEGDIFARNRANSGRFRFRPL